MSRGAPRRVDPHAEDRARVAQGEPKQWRLVDPRARPVPRDLASCEGERVEDPGRLRRFETRLERLVGLDHVKEPAARDEAAASAAGFHGQPRAAFLASPVATWCPFGTVAKLGVLV